MSKPHNLPKRTLITREEMAWVYAGILSTQGQHKDYPISLLNEKIIKKWSKGGLNYIKEQAWCNIALLHKELEGE